MTLEEQFGTSPAAQNRQKMADGCGDRLLYNAYNAIKGRGLDPMDFLIVCIKVDSSWRSVVERLMPDHESVWQAHRDRGAEPVAIGIVRREFEKVVLDRLPDLAPSLAERPEPGMATVVLLDGSGGTVCEIDTREAVPVREVVVNYAHIGMDEGWPGQEAVGTLIQAMSPFQYMIKISDTLCRAASQEEVQSWTGPTSPGWWKPKRAAA